MNTFTNYSVGDFLIRIKNASMAKNKTLEYKAEKQIVAVAMALKKMGFLDIVKKASGPDLRFREPQGSEKGLRPGGKENIVVSLAFKNKKPVITNLKLISKPGLRIYMGADEIEKKKGPSIYVLTTPKGVISSLEAVKVRSGGEVIAKIWW